MKSYNERTLNFWGDKWSVKNMNLLERLQRNVTIIHAKGVTIELDNNTYYYLFKINSIYNIY